LDIDKKLLKKILKEYKKEMKKQSSLPLKTRFQNRINEFKSKAKKIRLKIYDQYKRHKWLLKWLTVSVVLFFVTYGIISTLSNVYGSKVSAVKSKLSEEFIIVEVEIVPDGNMLRYRKLDQFIIYAKQNNITVIYLTSFYGNYDKAIFWFVYNNFIISYVV